MIGKPNKEKVLLLSIKPKYANKIFSGEKTVELRRTKPNLKRGDIVAVYVSSPIMALSGEFEVDEVLEREPEELWSEVGEESGIEKNEFKNYYRGAEIAFGIKFKKVVNFKQPVPLSNLRKTWTGFT
ncbi:MAG TPA: ASCH domain-containing protein, partial [bacterium]|nr:ASCH domain-containing protein [bacterium]